MPVETRGKDKEGESVFDKVRQLSPGSQHGQGQSHRSMITGLITPAEATLTWKSAWSRAESQANDYRLDHTSRGNSHLEVSMVRGRVTGQ